MLYGALFALLTLCAGQTVSPTPSPSCVAPPGYLCSGGSVLTCPTGSYCPGGANASLCPSGTFSDTVGASICTRCPGGHYCPAGTSSWARLGCGRGNYCPDGSGAPLPCPFQVPPSGGWGDLQAQGPAFLVETAQCLNHCFWDSTSGDGMLSKCADGAPSPTLTSSSTPSDSPTPSG